MMKSIVRFVALGFCFVFIIHGMAFAEKTVVTAEGKYVMGDLDTKQNAKVLALMEAKRISLEKAGTYVESLSEVKDYQLTKDQINSLASGIMSIEILKEDWQVSGESMVVILSVRATIDTSNIKSRISTMQENQDSSGNKEIKAQLAALQKELTDLKAQQAIKIDKEAPKQEKQKKEEMQKKNVGIINKIWALKNIEEGQARLQVQRYDEAVAAFKNALESDPDQAEAYAGMSIAFHWTKQPVKAIEMANEALKMDPKAPTGHSAMALIMYKDGKYDKALESINKAIDLYPKSPYYFLQRAETYLKLRDPDAAIKDFDRACAMKLTQGCKRADVVKKRIAAIDKEDKAKLPTPQKPAPISKTALENLRNGYKAMQNQRYEEAIAAFKSASDLEPSQAEPYAGLSVAYYWTKELAKAKEMADKALQIDPNSATGNYAWSRIHFEEAHYDKALESINQAIKIYPKSPNNYSLRGDIYMKLQKNDMALKNYMQACKMNFPSACRRVGALKQRKK